MFQSMRIRIVAAAALCAAGCGSAEDGVAANGPSDAGLGDSGWPSGDAAPDSGAGGAGAGDGGEGGASGPASRIPCSSDNCWMNAPALSGACGTRNVDEDFSTGLYNAHRFPLSAPGGVVLEVTLQATAGSWSPALLVLAADGTTLYDGEVAGSGEPAIESLASGRGGSSASLRITAQADTPVDLFVTSWEVVDGGFAGSIPSDATYTLSAFADCPAVGAVCPMDPNSITSFGSGYFTDTASRDPTSPYYDPYKRDDRTSHHGYDIYAPLRNDVVATQNGTIISVNTAPAADDLCGISINLAADSGVTFRHCHLDGVAVTAGTVVQAGDLIGYEGETGNAKLPHLHITYIDAPNVTTTGSLAQQSVKVNQYIDELCR